MRANQRGRRAGGRLWRPLVTSVLAVALVTALSGVASAHDHEPPRTMLRRGQATQVGRLGTYCWWRASPIYPIVQQECVDGTWSFPRAVTARRGARARILFEKVHEPEELQITSWRRLRRDGSPRGRGTRVRFSLEPRYEGGAVAAWQATFKLPRRPGAFYLDVFAVWTDQEGSEQQQDAQWTFRLKLR